MSNQNYRETERKFLVTELPDGYADYPCRVIRQYYLSLPESSPVLRVRQYGEEFLLTVKKRSRDDSLTCHEVEFPIEEEHFNQLRDMAGDRRIEKLRYLIPWEKLTIELDVFSGKLQGLIIAEIEYETPDSPMDHPLPPWFGKEVTRDIRYSNNTLSSRGMPG